MRSNVVIFLVMGAYFTVADIAYAIWSVMFFGYLEVIGTAAMALLVVLSVFIAFYLQMGYKRAGALPEDNLDGEIADDSGEVGFFAPWSWWPLVLGASGAIAFASLAVDWWLLYIAAPFAVIGIVGFVFEFSRGRFAH